MNKNERRQTQLGMPHGTAASKLRKMVLLHYVQKANEDFCYKCGARIETVEELSIEHKLPWEGRDTDLFWDLDNIAFSHVKCNRPHSHGATKLRKEGPEGTKWCKDCNAFVSVDLFSTVPSSRTGFSTLCRKHEAAYRANYRKRTGRR